MAKKNDTVETAEGIRRRGKKGSGSYEINFRPYRGGNRIQRIIHAKSITEAKVKRAEMIVEAMKTPQLEDLQRNAHTFEDIWPILERNVLADEIASGTMYGYVNVYKRLFTEFRLKKFPQITAPSQLSLRFFLEYKSYCVIDLKFEGIRTEFGKVRSILARFRDLGYCSKDLYEVVGTISLPKEKKKAFPEISHTDIKKLLLYIKKDRPDLYGVIYFMFRVGRRVTETCKIERSDVEWDSKLNVVKINVRAETTKTKEYAPLNYLDNDLQAHVKQYYSLSKQHKSPYLFLNKQYKQCKRNAIFNYLTKMSKEVLKIPLTAHYFRHRFCTETCKARLPLVDIQAICGIRDVQVLIKHYCHSSAEGQASVLEKTRL